MCFHPTFKSLAHDGTNPHFNWTPSRSASGSGWRIASTDCEGAMLYRGSSNGSSGSGTANLLTTCRLGTRKVNRPHMHLPSLPVFQSQSHQVQLATAGHGLFSPL